MERQEEQVFFFFSFSASINGLFVKDLLRIFFLTMLFRSRPFPFWAHPPPAWPAEIDFLIFAEGFVLATPDPILSASQSGCVCKEKWEAKNSSEVNLTGFRNDSDVGSAFRFPHTILVQENEANLKVN